MLLVLSILFSVGSSLNVGDQVGKVSGSPTWKYLLLDHNNGLAVIDTSGKAVWSCEDCGEARDVLPNGNIVTVVKGTGMVEKSADCKNVKIASSYRADGHEARIDNIDESAVIGITPSGCLNQKLGCEGITHWDLNAHKETMPIDLGNYFDPSKDWGYLSTKNDWMHTNCAGTGAQNNIIVGIRHLSAIVSFDHSSHMKQWALSSEITSNFTFGKDEDKFYNCHDAHQLSNGNILLYDNGNKRNGAPALGVTGHCEDAVTRTCTNMTTADCRKCGNAHASELRRSCMNWPHDMDQACSSSPSPSPSPPPPSPAQKYSRALERAMQKEQHAGCQMVTRS